MSSNHENFITRPRIIQLLAWLTLAIILYRYVYRDIKLTSFIDQLQSMQDTRSIVLLLLAAGLMPLNWLLESLKWQASLRGIIALPWLTSFVYVFQGISFGIITPGRIGEYGGRVVYLPSEVQSAGALGVFRCSLAQNLMNVGIGIWGFLVLSSSLSGLTQISDFWIYLLGCSLLLIIALAYIFFPWLINRIRSISYVRRWIPSVMVSHDSAVATSSSLRILVFSFIRYLVYCLQYVLILRAFGIELASMHYLAGVALIFAVQSLLPLTPLLQFTIRGSIAVFVFSGVSSDEASLVLSSYTMWLLNLLIPAIFGVAGFLVAKNKLE